MDFLYNTIQIRVSAIIGSSNFYWQCILSLHGLNKHY